MSNHLRKLIERKIVNTLVRDALAAGLTIDVCDGEETTLRKSTDPKAIRAALETTDEDYLILRTPEGFKFGWVHLIWGNRCDVISDHATRIEDIVKGASELAEKLEEKWA